MSDDTGYAFTLEDREMERFDPRKWGWEESLPYGHVFPESVGWGMPFYRNFMTDKDDNRLVIEWENPHTINRLYLNGQRMQPYAYGQLVAVVKLRVNIHE